MAKKEIYEFFGIKYDTKTGKLVSPIGLVNPLLINGNSKIGKTVYHFSTLPGKKEYAVNYNGNVYSVFGSWPFFAFSTVSAKILLRSAAIRCSWMRKSFSVCSYWRAFS